jgi:hypothetical protein
LFLYGEVGHWILGRSDNFYCTQVDFPGCTAPFPHGCRRPLLQSILIRKVRARRSGASSAVARLSADYSGNPAFRRPSAYLAKSAERRSPVKSLRSDTRNVGSSPASALLAAKTRNAG